MNLRAVEIMDYTAEMTLGHQTYRSATDTHHEPSSQRIRTISSKYRAQLDMESLESPSAPNPYQDFKSDIW